MSTTKKTKMNPNAPMKPTANNKVLCILHDYIKGVEEFPDVQGHAQLMQKRITAQLHASRIAQLSALFGEDNNG